jgi:hypothetical protein
MPKPAMMVIGMCALMLAFAIPVTATAKATQSAPEARVDLTAGKKKAKAAVKTCGAYMYRKDGQCVDARAKK